MDHPFRPPEHAAWRHQLYELAQAEQTRLCHNSDYHFIRIAEKYIAPIVEDHQRDAFTAEVEFMAGAIKAQWRRLSEISLPTTEPPSH